MVRLIILSLILAGCEMKIRKDTEPDKLGILTECKTDEIRSFCKFTNRKGEEVCAKTGDSGFTVPCSFYEGI